MAKKAQAGTKSGNANKKIDHEEAGRVLAAALMSDAKMRAAKEHPVVGPLMKKLGPKGVAQLSAMAENQQLTPCNRYS